MTYFERSTKIALIYLSLNKELFNAEKYSLQEINVLIFFNMKCFGAVVVMATLTSKLTLMLHQSN